MKKTMKKLFSKSGWLVMAAALLTGMASCSSDEDTVQSTVEQKGSTIHVTVGAGIGNGDTRSLVSVEGTTRTLQFTTGDRLYVYGLIPGTQYKYVAGFLNNITIDSTDPTQATFSGDLSVYESEGKSGVLTPSTYDGSADVLGDASATLVHANTLEGEDYTINSTMDIRIIQSMATNAEALMTTCLEVVGKYDNTNKDFNLAPGPLQPIVNCTIVGAPIGDITVTYENFYNNTFETKAQKTFTRNNPGDLTFAFFGGSNSGHKIKIETAYGNKVLNLGTKTLNSGSSYTVYPVTATWLPEVVSNSSALTPNDANVYTLSDGSKTTVSGYSGSNLQFQPYGSSNTIVLNGITADCEREYIVRFNEGSTIIDVNGVNNHITCTKESWHRAINGVQGEIRLRGEGTLTVTSKDAYACGILATNYTTSNNSNTTTTELDVSALLAEDGYKVTRSARTGNATDGYTWTYTVGPALTIQKLDATTEYQHWGNIYQFNEDAAFSISGTSRGFWFDLQGTDNAVTFNGFTAYTGSDSWGIISAWASNEEARNINLTLTGNDNHMYSLYKNDANCITCSGTLKLSGNGSLKVTVKSNTNYGLSAPNYANGNNVDDLAAEGYTVTRTGPTGNETDGYTWTYTVAPKNN